MTPHGADDRPLPCEFPATALKIDAVSNVLASDGE